MRRARSRQRSTASALVVALGLAGLTAGCGSDDDPQPTPDVSAAEAYIAIVRWEAAQERAGSDEDDDLPVIYLRAESGDTVDIGVQAEVVEATADDIVVRFSDDSDDSLDADLEGEPVKDNGVLLIVGDLPSGEATMDAVVRRYETIEKDTTFRVGIVASDEGAKVVDQAVQDGELD